ncbi:MAG TPA: glycosyltransferase [Candidatus Binatia bacterium]
MNIAFFGSSLVSAYWNGAATYYRGILRALNDRGHRIAFYEPDAWDRQKHRDIDDPPYAQSIVYNADDSDEVLEKVRSAARGADLLVKASGVGVFDELLEEAVLEFRGPGKIVVFWDVDAAATLERLQNDPADPLRALVPRYDAIFTYGGGDPVVTRYRELGARDCFPIYNALDPSTHFPTPHDRRFEADLSFVGNRLPDREQRVLEFFFKAAAKNPERRFLLGGNGWQEVAATYRNVTYLGHVYTSDHNSLNSTPLAVLNVCRDSMARCGFSPPTRVFEAAGAAACLITDAWEGVEKFLAPERECLIAHDGDEVAALLESLTDVRAREIGAAALKRVMAEHTYAHRAVEVEKALQGL